MIRCLENRRSSTLSCFNYRLSFILDQRFPNFVAAFSLYLETLNISSHLYLWVFSMFALSSIHCNKRDKNCYKCRIFLIVFSYLYTSDFVFFHFFASNTNLKTLNCQKEIVITQKYIFQNNTYRIIKNS